MIDSGAMAGNARRQRRHPWHSRECGFCNLQNTQGLIEFESHPLRHPSPSRSLRSLATDGRPASRELRRRMSSEASERSERFGERGQTNPTELAPDISQIAPRRTTFPAIRSCVPKVKFLSFSKTLHRRAACSRAERAVPGKTVRLHHPQREPS